jgi:hypothetical protein
MFDLSMSRILKNTAQILSCISYNTAHEDHEFVKKNLYLAAAKVAKISDRP